MHACLTPALLETAVVQRNLLVIIVGQGRPQILRFASKYSLMCSHGNAHAPRAPPTTYCHAYWCSKAQPLAGISKSMAESVFNGKSGYGLLRVLSAVHQQLSLCCDTPVSQCPMKVPWLRFSLGDETFLCRPRSASVQLNCADLSWRASPLRVMTFCSSLNLPIWRRKYWPYRRSTLVSAI